MKLPSKETILNTMTDSFSNLVYYQRKEDEDLSVEGFEEAIVQGVITPEEMVEKFKQEVDAWVVDIRRRRQP